MKKALKSFVILLCVLMLCGVLSGTAFAKEKLNTPSNLNLTGTVLKWNSVANADFYSVTLYHNNYQHSIGNWQTDVTSFNFYKYLKSGETYGATVIACSNKSYDVSVSAEISLTKYTGVNQPIYRDVRVVNATASATSAFPGQFVLLKAKPAPEGMVFNHWELNGAYLNLSYKETDSTVYIQTMCDHDAYARAVYSFSENVTSAFTMQPIGGSALLGKEFSVSYAMNFNPKGTVKVQLEGSTPGTFTDYQAGSLTSASISYSGAAAKTFRIKANDGTRNIYSDEFVVSWEDGPRFTSQPMGGVADLGEDFTVDYALNFTPLRCRVWRLVNDVWCDLSEADSTHATIDNYDFNTTETYLIQAIIEGGGYIFSDEFTVTWSDTVSKFIQQPSDATLGLNEDYSFSFAVNFTPDVNIAVERYNSDLGYFVIIGYCQSLTNGVLNGFDFETTQRYRLAARSNSSDVYSKEFSVEWKGDSTVQEPESHTHKYDTLCSDAKGHWYGCSCGAKSDFTAHTYTHMLTKASPNTKVNAEKYDYCQACGYETDHTVICYYPKTIALAKTSYTYDGKVKKPAVTVKDSKGKTIAAKYYTLTYAKGRKSVGSYTVIVKFTGNYTGSKKLTFNIIPKGTAVSKASSPKKQQLKLTWKKQTTQTTGYQILYSTDKNFKKGNRAVTINKNKTTSTTIKKLKSNKKYYVAIRTYKTVNGNKYYSGWKKYGKAIIIR